MSVADISESDREFMLTADVPGLAKEQVTVELDADNVLHISTEARKQHEDKGEKDVSTLTAGSTLLQPVINKARSMMMQGWVYHRMERSSSSQHRAVKMPANVDLAGIKATVDNGVLHVSSSNYMLRKRISSLLCFDCRCTCPRSRTRRATAAALPSLNVKAELISNPNVLP
jgi:HSP20 family molecular chaperone IbpA